MRRQDVSLKAMLSQLRTASLVLGILFGLLAIGQAGYHFIGETEWGVEVSDREWPNFGKSPQFPDFEHHFNLRLKMTKYHLALRLIPVEIKGTLPYAGLEIVGGKPVVEGKDLVVPIRLNYRAELDPTLEGIQAIYSKCGLQKLGSTSFPARMTLNIKLPYIPVHDFGLKLECPLPLQTYFNELKFVSIALEKEFVLPRNGGARGQLQTIMPLFLFPNFKRLAAFSPGALQALSNLPPSTAGKIFKMDKYQFNMKGNGMLRTNREDLEEEDLAISSVLEYSNDFVLNLGIEIQPIAPIASLAVSLLASGMNMKDLTALNSTMSSWIN